MVYVGCSFIDNVYAVHYEHHNATGTGYAFGGISASGNPLNQSSFANHAPRTMCDGSRDWSGDWAWGTKIIMDTPVEMRNSNNVPYTRREFYLYDNGDTSCSMGANWVDIHFGRYKEYHWNNCICSGVPNTSCVWGTNGVNNCSDATRYGRSTRGYTAVIE